MLRNQLFKVYRNSQKVIVLSADMQRRCEEHGVSAAALSVVANWVDAKDVRPIKTNNEFRRQNGLEDRFVIMYSGNMGLAHDLDTLLNAAELLRDRSELEWIFIGDGAHRDSLARRVERAGLTNVRFLPYQPRSFLAHSLSAADVHLISVRPGAAACMMPSKLYGILASGTPAIAVVEPETELSDLVNNHEVGFTCIPGDAESLAERIRELADNLDLRLQLGNNARKLAEERFSRIRQTARISELLHAIVGRSVPESRNEVAQPLSGPAAVADALTDALTDAAH
jgi:glycosyltransferase involved in cell wall biosynthesis